MNTRTSTGLKTNPQHQFTDLRTVLAKYVYHWPLFLLGLIIAAGGAYAYMYIVNPVYEVSATILVKDEKKSPEEKAALPELEQSSSPRNAEAEIEIVRSKNLITKVVNELQLWTNYTTRNQLKTEDLYETAPVNFVLVKKSGSLRGHSMEIRIRDKNSFQYKNLSGQLQTASFNQPIQSSFGTWMLKPTNFTDQYIGANVNIGLDDPLNVANAYLKNLDVHLLDKQAPTIGIFTTDEVPKRGQDFLNHLIAAYNNAAIEESKRKTKSTIDFIDKRLASLTGELNLSEKQVEGYRSAAGVADLSSQTKAYLENSQANEQKLNDVNVQLNIINGIERYVNSNSSSAAAPATIGISDPGLTSLVERLSQLQLKKTALLATTPEGNPLFEPLNQQIAATKASLRETIRGIKSSLLGSRSQLQAFNNKVQSSINNVPIQERQFGDMKRQATIKENLYIYLLQKREELALSYASTFADARIVDKATVGDIKWPRQSVVLAVTLLCGLGLPFLLLYFRESLGNRITSRRQIDALNIPILGELSYDATEKGIVVVSGKNNLLGEQIRALRTNLNYAHQNRKPNPSEIELDLHQGMVLNNNHSDGRGRVTLFTSSVSKEGKSFVSSNIAASLAASGRKTVILEMDLRKPKISGVFNVPTDHPGISEYLSYNIPLSDIIQHVPGVQDLDIIGCGQIPSDPSELLEKDRLIELINELRYRYDDIIIDSPPLHLVTDSAIIARTADVSLYIVRQGYTGKDELDFIDDTYQSDKLPNMNIVFNGIKRQKYGYGYNYDNSYYSAKAGKKSVKNSLKEFASRF